MTRIALGFVGDVCLGGGLQEHVVRHGADYYFENVRELFAPMDMVCGNLEFCAVAGPCAEVAKNVMKVPRNAIDGLARSGIGVWGLANNHVMDAGPAGLAVTRSFLEEHGLGHFGAGDNIALSERPYVTEIAGVRIALVGACDVPQCYATETDPGVAPATEARLLARVAAAKAQAAVVVCVLHADFEFSDYPAPARVRLARALVDHGADLVIQHHPHVVQGIERYGAGLIAYSLGNFVFAVAGNAYQERFPGTSWGAFLAVNLEITPGGKVMDWRVEPVTIDKDSRPRASQGQDRKAQLETLARLSRSLADPKTLRRQWLKRCMYEARSTYYVLHHTHKRAGVSTTFRQALETLRNPYERRWIYGLLTGGLAG
jgi:hypothetical protein